MAQVSSLGFAIALAIVIGLALGYWLDRLLGTSPWLTLVFLVLGIVAGFRNLYVIGKKSQE